MPKKPKKSATIADVNLDINFTDYSSVKNAMEILKTLYILANEDEDAYNTYLKSFLDNSNMCKDVLNDYIVSETQTVEEGENLCLQQLPIIDSLHDFGSLPSCIAKDIIKRTPMGSNNIYKNLLGFSMLQNNLYASADVDYRLSGANFSCCKVSTKGSLPALTGDIEAYALLLSMKRKILESGSVEDPPIKITKTLGVAGSPETLEIKKTLREYFSDYIDPGTKKINLLVDTMNGNLKKILLTEPEDCPFAYIVTKEGISDPAKGKCNPVDPGKAAGYYGRENVYYETMIKSSRKYLATGKTSEEETAFTSLETGFDNVFDINFEQISCCSVDEKKFIRARVNYGNIPENIKIESTINCRLNDEKTHPTNVPKISEIVVDKITGNNNQLIKPGDITKITQGEQNPASFYGEGGIFTNMVFDDDELNWITKLSFTKKRGGDGLQGGICKLVNSNKVVLDVFRLADEGLNGAEKVFGIDTRNVFNVTRMVLVTIDRVLFSHCVTNDIPAILQCVQVPCFVLFKPVTKPPEQIPGSFKDHDIPNPFTGDIVYENNVVLEQPKKKKKYYGGTAPGEEIETINLDIGDVIVSLVNTNPEFLYKIFPKLAHAAKISGGFLIEETPANNDLVDKCIEYIKNFEIMEFNKESDAIEDPVTGEYSTDQEKPIYNCEKEIISSIYYSPEDAMNILCIYNSRLRTANELEEPSASGFQYSLLRISPTQPLIVRLDFSLDERDYHYLAISVVNEEEDYKFEFSISSQNSTGRVTDLFKFTCSADKLIDYINTTDEVMVTRLRTMTNALRDIEIPKLEPVDLEKFITEMFKINEPASDTVGGGGQTVSYTQMPALNYYICIFYNTPIVVTSNEYMNNLVIMSYLSLLSYYETLLYSDNELFYSVFKAEDVYVTTTPVLYSFFHLLIQDIRKDISYNLLEYFLSKNDSCVEMFDDLLTIFEYLYSGLCIEIPRKTHEIVEEGIKNGIIVKDKVFEDTERYFNELYQKAKTNVDRKYLTPYAFMYMVDDFIEKTPDIPKRDLDLNEIKNDLDEIKNDLDEIKDDFKPRSKSEKSFRKSRRSRKSKRKSTTPRKSRRKSRTPRKSRRSSRKSKSIDKTRKFKQNFDKQNFELPIYKYDKPAAAAAAAGFNI
jgi:hypothetical protein